MASRGKGARAKGAQFERDIAKYFTENGIDAQRGLGQTRGGGEEIADVETEFIHIEAKRQKRCNIKAAMRQAIADTTKKSDIPVVITKDDRQPILVTLQLDDFMAIFKAYVELQKSTNQEEEPS